MRIGTPLTATPSSARIRIYRTPSMTRVSIRSLHAGLTRIVTSGVVTSNFRVSTRLRGLSVVSAPNCASYCSSKRATFSPGTPQAVSIARTVPFEICSGSTSLFALCSSIISTRPPCTDCTTSKLHASSSASPSTAPKVSFCVSAGIGGGQRNTASTNASWLSASSRA